MAPSCVISAGVDSPRSHLDSASNDTSSNAAASDWLSPRRQRSDLRDSEKVMALFPGGEEAALTGAFVLDGPSGGLEQLNLNSVAGGRLDGLGNLVLNRRVIPFIGARNVAVPCAFNGGEVYQLFSGDFGVCRHIFVLLIVSSNANRFVYFTELSNNYYRLFYDCL